MARKKPRKQDPIGRANETVIRVSVLERLRQARADGKPARVIAKLEREAARTKQAASKATERATKAMERAAKPRAERAAKPTAGKGGLASSPKPVDTVGRSPAPKAASPKSPFKAFDPKARGAGLTRDSAPRFTKPQAKPSAPASRPLIPAETSAKTRGLVKPKPALQPTPQATSAIKPKATSTKATARKGLGRLNPTQKAKVTEARGLKKATKADAALDSRPRGRASTSNMTKAQKAKVAQAKAAPKAAASKPTAPKKPGLPKTPSVTPDRTPRFTKPAPAATTPPSKPLIQSAPKAAAKTAPAPATKAQVKAAFPGREGAVPRTAPAKPAAPASTSAKATNAKAAAKVARDKAAASQRALRAAQGKGKAAEAVGKMSAGADDAAGAVKKAGAIRRGLSKVPGLGKLAPVADDAAKAVAAGGKAAAGAKKASLLGRSVRGGGKALGKVAPLLMAADVVNTFTDQHRSDYEDPMERQGFIGRALGLDAEQLDEDNFAIGGRRDAEGNLISKPGGGLGSIFSKRNFGSGKAAFNFGLNQMGNITEGLGAVSHGLGSVGRAIWSGDGSQVINPFDSKNWLVTNDGRARFDTKGFHQAAAPESVELSDRALRSYMERREQGLINPSPGEDAEMQRQIDKHLGPGGLASPTQNDIRDVDPRQAREASEAKLRQFLLDQPDTLTAGGQTPDGADSLNLEDGQAYIPELGGIVNLSGYKGTRKHPTLDQARERRQGRRHAEDDRDQAHQVLRQRGIDPSSEQGREMTRKHLAAASEMRRESALRARERDATRDSSGMTALGRDIMDMGPSMRRGLGGGGSAGGQFGDDEVGQELNKMSSQQRLQHFGDMNSATTSKRRRAAATTAKAQRTVSQRQRAAQTEESRTRQEAHEMAVARAKGRETDPYKDMRTAVVNYMKPDSATGTRPTQQEVMRDLFGLDPGNEEHRARFMQTMQAMFGMGAGAEAEETDRRLPKTR